METSSFLMQQFAKLHPGITSIGCIDAGGSKTFFQLFDKNGLCLPLHEKQIPKEALIGKGANLSSLPRETVEKHFKELFHDVTFANAPLKEHLSKTFLICGAAGASKEEAKNQLLEILTSCGFEKSNIHICNDAELALELSYNNGAIVIGGTGSICFGRKDEKTFRSGGLGRFLGDEGSGHHIGTLALKSALSYEIGFGKPTSLLEAFKNHFQKDSLRDLLGRYNKGEMLGSEVASLALLVFQEAEKKDTVSLSIVQEAANHLAQLLIEVINSLDIFTSPIYLYGSLFKSSLLYSLFKEKLHQYFGSCPLLINLSQENLASLVVGELLLRQEAPLYSHISSLPVFPVKQEGLKISIQGVTTEEKNPLTQNLSTFFPNAIQKGLQVLLSADNQISDSLQSFSETVAPLLIKTLQTRIQKGRIFLCGAGSSGRAALLLSDLFKTQNKVVPILAGGITTFVRAKEGMEDSFEQGYLSAKNANVTENDTVFLLSASSVAKFNLGVAAFAKEQKSLVYALTHTTTLPSHAKKSFEDLSVPVLTLDAGPQSITGSTRLQAANCSILGLGDILEGVFFSDRQSINRYKEANSIIQNALPDIAKLVEMGYEVFSSKEANFTKAHDLTKEGFLTYLGNKKTILEILMDTTETAPTFSINPPRKTVEGKMKEAEMRAYLIGEDNNLTAWKKLSNQPLSSSEEKETEVLFISKNGEGFGSYHSRSKGKGNLLLAVVKGTLSEKELLELTDECKKVKKEGGKTALLAIQEKPNDTSIQHLRKECDHSVILGPVAFTTSSLIPAVILKQTLNMISNGIMACMGKIHGNTMIDVSPSNQKLILRSIKIIKELLLERSSEKTLPSDTIIREVLVRIFHYKRLLSQEHGHELPSAVRIAFTIFEHSCDLNDALSILGASSLSSCSCTKRK